MWTFVHRGWGSPYSSPPFDAAVGETLIWRAYGSPLDGDRWCISTWPRRGEDLG